MGESYRFTGVNSHGEQRAGKFTAPDGLGALVKSRFAQGWRYLMVCAGDGPVPPSFADQQQVAGIGPHPDTGKRIWWAESGK
jgi:hypothetical protein